MAFSGLYTATKVFDRFLSYSLWQEQIDLKMPIDVLSLEPGATKTGFRSAATQGADKSEATTSAWDVANTALDDMLARRPNSIFKDSDYFSIVALGLLPTTAMLKVGSIFAQKYKTTQA